MNILIDTNVMLDALMHRNPHNVSAEKIFRLAAEDKLNASITANSVTDIYYFISKYFKNTNQAKQILHTIFNVFEIIDITQHDCEKALNLPMDDYEDALIATCAKRKRIELIITRNLKDFAGSPVTAISPEEFLANYF